MKILALSIALLCGAIGFCGEEPIERIAFGSCYKPQKQTQIWEEVEKFKPQIWIWLGDNFYNDWADGKYFKNDDDADCFAKNYKLLEESEALKSLKRIDPKIMATWDDHDYGKNDAGKEYTRKKESRKAFVKFFGNPDQPDGVYSSQDFGPAGKCIRVICLDTRFNRDPLPRKGEGASMGDILGGTQWGWLEKELLKPGADLTVVGSSIQLVSDQHRFEKWANFPKARERFLALLEKTKARGVIVLSGDRHWAEISRLEKTPAGYPLYDVTSSGLTEQVKFMNEENRSRVGAIFIGHNFGGIRIDWAKEDPWVTLEIHGENGQNGPTAEFPLSQLAPPRQ